MDPGTVGLFKIYSVLIIRGVVIEKQSNHVQITMDFAGFSPNHLYLLSTHTPGNIFPFISI
jgi:hypothetical protein